MTVLPGMKLYLHQAVLQCDLTCLKALLRAGADVNAASNEGQTALHIAAQQGHHRIVKQLLAAGAAVGRGNRHAAAPLHAGAGAGHEVVVKVLLAAGVCWRPMWMSQLIAGVRRCTCAADAGCAGIMPVPDGEASAECRCSC